MTAIFTTPILDREIIEELVFVMGDDMAEFIGTFIAHSADLLGQMTRHAENSDLNSLILVVHSFKGSSKNIGACLLGDLLTALEMSLRNEGLANVDPAFPRVHHAYEDVCSALQTYLH